MGLLQQCLKGIILLQLDFEHEVIVIDNASGDNTGEMIKKYFPSVKFIQSQKNLGYGGGVNLGIKAAKGRYLMILNPDIVILTNEIGKMINYMDEHPQIGILGPKLINPDGSLQYSCYRFPTFFIPFYRRTILGKLPWLKKKVAHYLMMDWDHTQNREVDWTLGGCWLLRKSAQEKIGLMDERFFMYFDDVDYCRRVWEAGYKVVYFAGTEIVHYHQRSSAETSLIFGITRRVVREHIKSWIKYFAKYFGAPKPNHEK